MKDESTVSMCFSRETTHGVKEKHIIFDRKERERLAYSAGLHCLLVVPENDDAISMKFNSTIILLLRALRSVTSATSHDHTYGLHSVLGH